MEMQATSETRGSTVQCLIALGLILLAFRIGDVSPSLAASALPGTADVAPWDADLAGLDTSLARQDVSAAAQRWQAGYTAALASGRWEGLVAMGDAARRIGAASGTRQAGDSRSRSLYLSALFRARQQGALDGVLRVASAFAELGDREVVTQSLRIASDLAARSGGPEAEARVRAFSGQLAAK
ncbi:MAG: hypothetical protein HY359_03205 [Candidatus Rokubacteria bacterium]|nr:hypothetical protein [Candidatus Rokubacteria bacterium]